jgi:hypothetical protein
MYSDLVTILRLASLQYITKSVTPVPSFPKYKVLYPEEDASVRSVKMDNLGVKKVEAPSKCPEKWLKKLLSQKKNVMSQSFLNSGILVISPVHKMVLQGLYQYLGRKFLYFFTSKV